MLQVKRYRVDFSQPSARKPAGFGSAVHPSLARPSGERSLTAGSTCRPVLNIKHRTTLQAVPVKIFNVQMVAVIIFTVQTVPVIIFNAPFEQTVAVIIFTVKMS